MADYEKRKALLDEAKAIRRKYRELSRNGEDQAPERNALQGRYEEIERELKALKRNSADSPRSVETGTVDPVPATEAAPESAEATTPAADAGATAAIEAERRVSGPRPDAGVNADCVAAAWDIGDVILDEYEVTGVLGEGGMGTVYKVHHRDWDLDMAVKCPKPELFQAGGHKENFVRECHSWMDLGLHPHTVTCHYVRVLGGIPRVFAEYVEGGSLKDWIDEGRLYEGGKDESLRRILGIAIEFAWGLQHAHEKGLIHQDVKPDNVMLTLDGLAKVTDFGLANARAIEGQSGKPPKGHSILASYGGMTPAYCSPEQADNAARRQAGASAGELAKLSRRTDIYSWAVSIFEMFTGGVTWQAGNIVGTALDSYLEDDGADDDVPAMPGDLAVLVKQCLAQNPDDRPNDFAECVDKLKSIYETVIGAPFPAESPTPPTELADVLNNKALSFLELGNAPMAEDLWKQAIAQDPLHVEATYNEAMYQWSAARITDDEVVRRLDEVRRSHRETSRDEYLLTLVHIARRDREAANVVVNDINGLLGDSPQFSRAIKSIQSIEPLETLVFSRDECWIPCVRLSPDGQSLVAANSREVRIWNLGAKPVDWTLSGHRGQVTAISISKNGRWFVTGSDDKSIILWDLAKRKRVREVARTAERIRTVSISGDGGRVLSCGVDGLFCLWDVETGKCLFERDRKRSGVLTSDGLRGLSVSFEGDIYVWDFERGELLGSLERASGRPDSVLLSHDESQVFSWGTDNVSLWDLETRQLLRRAKFESISIETAALSRDKKVLVTGGSNGDMRVWETAGFRCLRTIRVHTRNILSICFDPDTRIVYSAGEDSLLLATSLPHVHKFHTNLAYEPSLVSSSVGMVEQELEYQRLIADAENAIDDNRLSDAIALSNRLRDISGRRRDTKALDIRNTIRASVLSVTPLDGWTARTFQGHLQAVTVADWTGIADEIVSTSKDGSVRFWNSKTGECVDSLGRGGRYVCVGGGGRHVLCLDGAGTVTYYQRDMDSMNGRQANAVLLGKHRLAVGRKDVIVKRSIASNQRLAVLSGDCGWSVTAGETIKIWHNSLGICLRDLGVESADAQAICLSRDQRLLASGHKDGTIRLWDTESAECVRTLFGHRHWVTALSMSLDSRRLFSGCMDSSLRVWDVFTGDCVRTLAAGKGLVYDVDISTSGEWGISACSGSRLRFWHLKTGTRVREFVGHLRDVTSVRLSNDLRYFLSGSLDNTVRLWELDWKLEAKESANWNDDAEPYLNAFLTRHTPYVSSLPTDREPTEGEIRLALAREGKPTWSEEDFQGLLETLSWVGYGWLQPADVRRKLEEMAAGWNGLPPLFAFDTLEEKQQADSGMPEVEIPSNGAHEHEIVAVAGSGLDVKWRCPQTAQLPVMDLGMCIQKLIPLFDDAARKKSITVEWDTLGDKLPVHGQEQKVFQLIANLLSNAVKFSHEGGTVVFRVEATDETVKVSVIDSGIGIGEENLDRIFERFVQLDQKSVFTIGGVGSGLTVAKEIAHAHDTRICVTSALDVGSTFSFFLRRGELKK